MDHIEIERKFLLKKEAIPERFFTYPHKELVAAYLSSAPVIRIRREGGEYILTYKNHTADSPLARTEYNLPLDAASFEHLLPKADGNIIEKTRYYIPLAEAYLKKSRLPDFCRSLVVEMDLFAGRLSPLAVAEVEFQSEEDAAAFTPPEWFGRDVSLDPAYTNVSLSQNDMLA